MENYQILQEFPNYEISDLGNVRSKIGKILSPCLDHKGYRMVGLRKNGKTYTKRIGRLVAITFITNPLNKKQVNHKDGNRANDVRDNLEWNTGSENINHAYQTLKRKGSQTGKKGGLSPFSKKIIQLSKEGEEIKIWDSMIEAAEHFKVKRQSIKSCVSGKCITIKGFKWKFYE